MTNPQPLRQPRVATSPDSPTSNPPKPKTSKKPYIIGMVICALLAAAGTAFGVYGILNTKQKSDEISALNLEIDAKNQQNSSLQSTISELESQTSIQSATPKSESQSNAFDASCKNLSAGLDSYQNPVLSSGDSIECSALFEIYLPSAQPSSSNPPFVTFGVVDGNLTGCTIWKTLWNESIGDCEVNGLSGKISKIVGYQDNGQSWNNEIALLMQDGTVQIVKNTIDDVENISFSVDKTLDIDGFVVDILYGPSRAKDSMLAGGNDLFFVLADGSIIPYHSIETPAN